MGDNSRSVRLRVGRNVRALRVLRGFSQERLAESVGNTYKHIGQVERGEVNVTLDVLTGIAAGLSVDVADLFARPGKASTEPRLPPLTEDELRQMEQALLSFRRVIQALRPPRE